MKNWNGIVSTVNSVFAALDGFEEIWYPLFYSRLWVGSSWRHACPIGFFVAVCRLHHFFYCQIEFFYLLLSRVQLFRIARFVCPKASLTAVGACVTQWSVLFLPETSTSVSSAAKPFFRSFNCLSRLEVPWNHLARTQAQTCPWKKNRHRGGVAFGKQFPILDALSEDVFGFWPLVKTPFSGNSKFPFRILEDIFFPVCLQKVEYVHCSFFWPLSEWH